MNEPIDSPANALTPTSSNEAKPKGRPKGKGKPSTTEGKGKRSLNLSIPQEDYERFVIHAMRANLTISDLFIKLGREHLREYHITRTPSRDAG